GGYKAFRNYALKYFTRERKIVLLGGKTGSGKTDVLKKLNELYNKWIDNYKEGPLLVIDCDKNKFAEHDEHLGEVISKVDSMLFGLF
ncbi:MAG TPA: deoxynucleoside kinase, partial [Chitinophagaceae bacterium]|nr:deoxynucleoside kinase [Chitinophagaceae bacterium]